MVIERIGQAFDWCEVRYCRTKVFQIQRRMAQCHPKKTERVKQYTLQKRAIIYQPLNW